MVYHSGDGIMAQCVACVCVCVCVFSCMSKRRVYLLCACLDKPVPGCTASTVSECVCAWQLGRWSLILTTGKSQSHNALGAAPNEEAVAAAMRNQSQLDYLGKKKVHSLYLFLSLSSCCCSSWTAIIVLSFDMNWVQLILNS